VTVLFAGAGALALAACDGPDRHAQETNTYALAQPGPQSGTQPNAAALPPPPALPAGYPAGAYGAGYAGQGAPVYDGYALAERARSFDRAVYRRRPAYAFRYRAEQPLVWRTADDYALYAEPYDGGYLDYYYAPGAYAPYFVRDDRYGYCYGPDGRVVAIYDAEGELLPQDRWSGLLALAADYLLRARTLRHYGLDRTYWIDVSDDDWARRGPSYYLAEAPWYEGPWLGGTRQAFGYGGYGRRGYVEAPVYGRHDNGRHLGWYKDHGREGHEGRRVALAEARPWTGGGHGGWGGGWKHEGGGDHGGGRFAVASAQPWAGHGGGQGGKHEGGGGGPGGGQNHGHGGGGDKGGGGKGGGGRGHGHG